MYYTPHVRSTVLAPAVVSQKCLLGVGIWGTHRKDVHGRAHDNLEELSLVRPGTGGHIAAGKAHREAERMGDVDCALLTSACRVEYVAVGWEVQVHVDRPRAWPQELRDHLRPSTLVPESGEWGLLVGKWIVLI